MNQYSNSKGFIYVAAHEVLELPHNDLYRPILVGASSWDERKDKTLPEGFLRDDTGEQISDHNGCLSELTGLYWIWKNRDDDFAGLVHYRRFFALHYPFGWPFRKGGPDILLTRAELDGLMDRYDILLPRKRHYFLETLYSHYSHTFDHRHLDTARKIIKELCPDYLPAFDRVMGMRSGYMFNMMIMKKEILDSYCSWLFPILFELERREVRPEMDAFQKRLCGRVGERLCNVWLCHQISRHQVNKERISELAVLRTDPVHWFRKAAAFMMARFFHRRYERSW